MGGPDLSTLGDARHEAATPVLSNFPRADSNERVATTALQMVTAVAEEATCHDRTPGNSPSGEVQWLVKASPSDHQDLVEPDLLPLCPPPPSPFVDQDPMREEATGWSRSAVPAWATGVCAPVGEPVVYTATVSLSGGLGRVWDPMSLELVSLTVTPAQTGPVHCSTGSGLHGAAAHPFSPRGADFPMREPPSTLRRHRNTMNQPRQSLSRSSRRS